MSKAANKQTAGPGRPKGSQNIATGSVRDMLKGVVEGLGPEWLLKEAKKHPTAFFGLIAKLVPTAIEANVQHDVVYRVISKIPDRSVPDAD